MIEPKIIYEDNHVIVVIKPHNISVQEDESKDKRGSVITLKMYKYYGERTV